MESPALDYRCVMTQEPILACPTCGTQSPVGASFCGNCGASLTAGATTAAPLGTAAPVADSDSRNWAMGAHLTALAGVFVAGLASFVGPLVIWLMRRETDPFAAEHALEALNFNLMVLVAVIIGGILGIGTLGIGFLVIGPLILILGVLWFVWTLQATMAASRGEPYRYPLSVRLVR